MSKIKNRGSMNSFTDFYLLQETETLKVDWRNGVYKGTEINKAMYQYSKKYFLDMINLKNGFKANDKIFKVISYVVGDPGKSEIIDKGMLRHDWDSIKEIIKYNMNYGTVYLISVAQGTNEYYYIGNDKKFTNNSNTTIYRILDFLKPKQDSAAQKKETKEKERIDARNKKMEDDNREKSKVNINSNDPRNGRFGYFDIDYKDYGLLREKFMQNNNWLGKKHEYEWHTDTRNSSMQEFGQGYFYIIKGSPKGLSEGKAGTVYIFKYFKNVLPNVAMIIFDGLHSLKVFNELQILKGNDVIGLDKKVHLQYSSQINWFNVKPSELSPVDTAENLDR